jgi:NAD(P)-dependent dehydrogenase (short-subunit alcohol dehydrogenase family)
MTLSTGPRGAGSVSAGPRLAGSVCMITGAANGLGRVAALRFAAEGAKVMIADRLDGSAVVEEINSGGGTAAQLICDVTSEDSWAEVAAATIEQFGSIDVLMNNAGVMLSGDDDPVATSMETYHRTMDINVMGTLLGCKTVIPQMLNQGHGVIVNVASFVAHMGAATPQIAYTASKGAVLAMTREIAVTYARRGIRANALCPGPVMTPLLAEFLRDDAARERRRVHIPMGRFGEAMEIANGALFLASQESSFMTGQSLIVDGGITAAYTTPVD